MYAWSPSSRSSSTPATTTVCAVLQSSAVNARLPCAPSVSGSVSTTPSPSSPLATATVTAPTGSLASRTVNVAVSPASVVRSPPVGDTTTPASSASSVVVTATSTGARPP